MKESPLSTYIWVHLKSRVSEICVKRIHVNQGVGVFCLILNKVIIAARAFENVGPSCAVSSVKMKEN